MFLISIPCDKIFQFVLNLLTLKFYKSIKIGYNFYIIDTRASILPCSFLVTGSHIFVLVIMSIIIIYHYPGHLCITNLFFFFCFNATKIIGTKRTAKHHVVYKTIWYLISESPWRERSIIFHGIVISKSKKIITQEASCI